MSVRSVLVDGSARGRVAAYVQGFVPAHDGSRVYFASAGGGVPWRVFSCSLDDGTVERITESVTATGVCIASVRPRACFSNTNGKIRWHDLDTGEEGKAKVPSGASVVAISPDGTAICTVRYERSDQTRVSVHRLSDGSTIATIKSLGSATFDEAGRAILRSVEGAFVAVSPSGEINADLVPTLRMTGGFETMLAERGGTRLLLASYVRNVTVLDLAKGVMMPTLALGRESRVESFAKGKALVRGRGETLSLVDVETGARRELPPLGRPAALTRDGATVVAFREPLIVAFDLAKGTLRAWHDGHDRPVVDLAWSSDGSLLASLSVEGVVRVWDVTSRSLLWVFEGARGNAAAIVFAPDGRLLYAIGQRALLAWDLSSGEEVQRHARAGHRVSAAAISPDGRYLATLGVGMPLRVHDLTAGAQRVASLDVPNGLTSIAFSREGSVRLLGNTSPDSIWASWCDPHGRALSSRGHALGRGFVSFDDDASSLLVLRDRRVVRFDLRDGSETDVCERGSYEEALCANSRFAVGDSFTRGEGGLVLSVRVAVVSIETGREAGAIELSHPVRRASLSPDGAHLALAYADARVEVFALDDVTA